MFFDQILPQETLSILRELAESRAFYPTMVYPAVIAIITGIILYLLIIRQKFIKHRAGSAIMLLIKAGRYIQRQRTDAKVKNIYKSFENNRTINIGNLIEMGCTALGGIIIVSILTKKLFLAVVITQSMAPLIMPGELVLTEAFTKNITVGDVIVFVPPDKDRMYVHRVISVSEGIIKTKGDNALPDTWKLTQDNIKGKAISINQKPVVIKGLEYYFMPIDDPIRAQDPSLKATRGYIEVMRTYGPFISIIIMLFIILTVNRK